jgi:hypothetical protein
MGFHISIARLTAPILREKVATHLHLRPGSRDLTLIYDTATSEALALARNHNWKNEAGEPLRINVREHGR